MPPLHDPSSRIYVHEPLSRPRTIRLFNLFAATSDGDRLRGSFVLHQLDPTEREVKGCSPAIDMYDVMKRQLLPYVALSYTWLESDTPTAAELAPSDVDCAVFLPDGRLIHITPNLRSFLHRIRSPGHDQRLWIDQLCIRQDPGDTALPSDKEQQIPLMRDIYAQAAGVILWVGEADGADDLVTPSVFELISNLAKYSLAAGVQASAVWTSNIVPSTEDMHARGLPSPDSPAWLHLLHFTQRRIFSRLWVLQEVVVAKQVVVCQGGLVIDLNRVGLAVLAIEMAGWWFTLHPTRLNAQILPDLVEATSTWKESLAKLRQTSIGFASLLTMVVQRLKYGSKHKQSTMEQLLLYTNTFSSSREYGHDRVYALLGLATDVQAKQHDDLPDALVPDYTKTAEQVYREVTEYCLCQGSLAILGAVGGPLLRAKDSPLPSWVPDLSNPGPRIGPAVAPFEFGGTYAERPRPDGIRVTDDMLVLDGCRVDTIREVQEALPGDLWSPTDRLEMAARLVDNPSAPYAADVGSSCLEAFWRTILLNTHLNKTPAPDFTLEGFAGYVLQSFLIRVGMVDDDGRPLPPRNSGNADDPPTGLQRLLSGGLMPVLDGWQRNKLGDAAAVVRREHTCATGVRLFFVTEGGLFGLGPLGTKPGDDVFVFGARGAPPMVLSGAETAAPEGQGPRDSYILVGESYLHGVEELGVLAGDPSEVPWTEVRIR